MTFARLSTERGCHDLASQWAGWRSERRALQRNPARAHATPRSRRRLVAVSAMAPSACTASLKVPPVRAARQEAAKPASSIFASGCSSR